MAKLSRLWDAEMRLNRSINRPIANISTATANNLNASTPSFNLVKINPSAASLYLIRFKYIFTVKTKVEMVSTNTIIERVYEAIVPVKSMLFHPHAWFFEDKT